jgi:hypothetical protein
MRLGSSVRVVAPHMLELKPHTRRLGRAVRGHQLARDRNASPALGVARHLKMTTKMVQTSAAVDRLQQLPTIQRLVPGLRVPSTSTTLIATAAVEPALGLAGPPYTG